MVKIIPENLDKSLPGFTSASRPDNLKTRNQWKKSRRKVRKGEKPVARLAWEVTELAETECFLPDGTTEKIKERVPVGRECGLFTQDQTAPYRGTRRTWAIEIFRHYFVGPSSREHYIWWMTDHWQSCHGKLQEWQMKLHLNGKGRYGVRGGKWTRFLALDLDLHNGDQAVFFDQLRVLQAEFHGKDGWHYQVAEQNAGGIHFIQCFRQIRLLKEAVAEMRRHLEKLDHQHPELAVRARAAGMKTLGELEIFPNPANGFRLPLCSGRTILLDRPLPLVFNKKMKREVQDVVGYVSWLSKDNKTYMPAEEVFSYVKDRLAPPKPKEQPKSARQTERKATVGGPAGGMADLGPMKGQFAPKLVGFWTGANTPPDSLNQGIVLLARVLPFYLDNEEDAVDLIDRYIDELPDVSFSDRLTSGNRAEASRVVRNTVKTVYQANGGQADPETSTAKLQATVAAWKKRGFDPTDKTTWDRATVNNLPDVSVNNFFWRGEDVIKLGQLQAVLNASLESVSTAMKYLLNLVKKHSGEIAINLVKKVLEKFGIASGHHGKANMVMKLLCQWNWIYIRAFERWYPQVEDGEKHSGRARSYGVGAEMVEKFEDTGSGTGNNTTHTKHLYIVSRHSEPLDPLLVTSEPSGDEISLGWP